MAWQRGVVAWARAIHQYHVNGTDTVGRLVSRSVDARGPVDHTSVGLAQAHPKKHIMVCAQSLTILNKAHNVLWC